ncbi:MULTISPECIES: hypothetical protein [Vibrio harveyi group]|uniref:hypothetical protein n=1 Tax=Vibrio harveyi group TaxID=717610 RepID=UPI0031BB94C9
MRKKINTGRTLKQYKKVLEECAKAKNPLTEGLKEEDSTPINAILKDLEEKGWITFDHGQNGNLHYTSKVSITCDGLIGLAEIEKIVLEKSPVYASLLSIQNMLFTLFGAILMVGGKLVYDILK